MRSDPDKEIDTIDLDQLFDQYFETDLFQQYSDTTTGQSSSEDLSYLFEEPSSNGSDPCDTTTLPNWGTSNEDVAWHKAVQRPEEQNAASPLIENTSSSVYPHSGGKASLSDPVLCGFEELVILDDLEPRPASQPSTPTRIARPSRKELLSPDRPIRHGVHKSAHKKPAGSSTFSKMMRPSTYRAGFQDLWTRKVDTAADSFNFHMPQNEINSPPPSTKLVQDEQSNGFFPRDSQPYTIAISPLPGDTVSSSSGIQTSHYQLTPLSSPAIDINSENSMANPFQLSNDAMGGAYITNTAALSALQTPPPSSRIPMDMWGTGASPTVDFSSFSSSPDFQSASKTAGWWTTNSGSIPVTQSSTPSAYQGSSSRSASHNLGFGTASTAGAGLGISCDTTSFANFGPDLDTNPSGLSHSASFDVSPYTAVYPSTPGIPIGHGPANPPSRSPSLSPQPRFTRRRHSSHPHNRTASRRKSSNSSQHVSHVHSRGASMGGGFVNFTPDDSRKILTGVAPSGSSKTKARREKEAAEKRRKLSQAAVKAVIEAGGDLGRLEKEGLLVLES
ncbi:hypothetical protein GRF29_216g951306 [Pseudopithomyces chartarum]|uniref:Developmental regulatory protein wetA n=1 Tax=Pseudopithomyces chartarum TaxID=1892770 RepID=A0AAN6RB41_9PLEO|nr:hypothetical protein GRF29_216g951306 [Pseudopithomyces chartarum]